MPSIPCALVQCNLLFVPTLCLTTVVASWAMLCKPYLLRLSPLAGEYALALTLSIWWSAWSTTPCLICCIHRIALKDEVQGKLPLTVCCAYWICNSLDDRCKLPCLHTL